MSFVLVVRMTAQEGAGLMESPRERTFYETV